MSSCRLFSHSWDYASGGVRTCKRCASRERFNLISSEWQGY